MFASLAAKDDVTEVKDELALVKLDLADLDRDVRDGLALVRTEMHGTKHEIIGAFRGELNAAITAQTRPLLYALLGTAIVFAGSLRGAMQLLEAHGRASPPTRISLTTP